MSTYAYVNNGSIVEFKEIGDQLYASWVSANNPKKDVYKIVNYSSSPSVSENQVAESTFEILQNSVDQVWTVRNKTADELRKTYTAYEFLLRFTTNERASFRAAALTDSSVADFQQLAGAAHEIVTDDPTTISGMDYLVSVGLITQERRDEILS